MFATVDDDDFEWLSQWKWFAHVEADGRAYADRRGPRSEVPRRTIRMHRLIMDAPEGMVVDHINGDGLDNRRENLRICTHSENKRNQVRSMSRSGGYKGVTPASTPGRWRARITVNGVERHLGTFDSPEEAASVRDRYARDLHGEFASLNGVSDG